MDTLLFLLALMLDFLLGDPHHWPHPIVYVGKTIQLYEAIIRKYLKNLKVGGVLLLLVTLITTLSIAHGVMRGARQIHPILGSIATLYFIYALLAAKSLDTESKKVYQALHQGNVAQARKEISYLVGRDTQQLNQEEITLATVETVAENTIDGVLAPLFYGGLGLLVGYPVEFMMLYKTVNTLDSMVGYIQEPYKDIGCASAKLDDFVNYIPARIGSFFMLLAGGLLGYDMKNGWNILKRDRLNHKSPNCGYPEAAVAGLLQIQLGGTHTYFGQTVYKPTIGDRQRSPEPKDILSTIHIMYVSEILFTLCCIIPMISVGYGILIKLG